MADAMEMMLLSFLGPAVACEWGLTPAEEAALSTSVFVGMAFGGFLWGAASDAFGRRAAFFIPSLVTFVAGVNFGITMVALMPSSEACRATAWA